MCQSYANWEQIVIDDGSTDETAEIVAKYSHPRLRYHRQPNQGPDRLAATYNSGLSRARGQLIAILEGDDFWPRNKLSTLVPRFADPHVVLAYGSVADVNASGRASNRRRTGKWRASLPNSVLRNDPVGSALPVMLSAHGPSLIPAPTVMLRRSALEKIGGFRSFSGLRTTDYPTYLHLALQGNFAFEEGIMGVQRRHFGSITTVNIESGFNKASECAQWFGQQYGQRANLTKMELQQIEMTWARSRPIVDFSSGRGALIERKWALARSYFVRALRSPDLMVRAASCVGWVTSWFHADMEFVMQSIGRASLR